MMQRFVLWLQSVIFHAYLCNVWQFPFFFENLGLNHYFLILVILMCLPLVSIADHFILCIFTLNVCVFFLICLKFYFSSAMILCLIILYYLFMFLKNPSFHLLIRDYFGISRDSMEPLVILLQCDIFISCGSKKIFFMTIGKALKFVTQVGPLLVFFIDLWCIYVSMPKNI